MKILTIVAACCALFSSACSGDAARDTQGQSDQQVEKAAAERQLKLTYFNIEN